MLPDEASGIPSGNGSFTGSVKPGEIRNPEGRNQYTYKRDYEQALDRLCNGEVTEDLIEFIPESVRPLLGEAMTGGAALAKISMALALAGDRVHLPELLKRVFPVTEKRQHFGADGGPIQVAHQQADLSNLSEDEKAELQRLAHKALEPKGDT